MVPSHLAKPFSVPTVFIFSARYNTLHRRGQKNAAVGIFVDFFVAAIHMFAVTACQ